MASPSVVRIPADASLEGGSSACASADADSDAKRRFSLVPAYEALEPVVDGPSLQRGRAPDLDGDGLPEIVYGFGMPVASESHLYAGGKGCRYLGRLEGGGELVRLPRIRDGHSDFRLVDYGATCEGALGGCEPRISFYHYEGAGYVEDRAARIDGHGEINVGFP